ncbi:MAG: substrate-binding domain-containing protein [Betaproteobacteria bacterium]|nr:substrate-binding domain-containing protein [Betaproteobacteria bacterium]
MKFRIPVLAAALLFVGVTTPAIARDNIQIAGSSTVLPFSSIVAENFGKTFPQFKAPVVGSGGTGGGMRQFCQGVGANTIDIANASRPMRPDELKACQEKGVKGILEVKFGYDGIVFAARSDGGRFALEPQHIFLAGAKEVPQGGKMVANPYTRWSQIDRLLPNQEIVLVIPGSNHGTREVYEEKAVIPGCMSLPEVKAMEKADKKKAESFCKAIRTDGRVVEVAGDYTETLARLDAQRTALGVFGLSFYDQNRDRLRIASINGVEGSDENILSGKYPVSRPLFFYIKDAHVGVIPGLLEYGQYFLSQQVSGKGSPLEKAGLIPLSTAERAKAIADLKARKSL